MQKTELDKFWRENLAEAFAQRQIEMACAPSPFELSHITKYGMIVIGKFPREKLSVKILNLFKFIVRKIKRKI